MKIQEHNIPQEMKDLPQWVCWKLDDKRGKVPINPHTMGMAKSSDSGTWASFDKATSKLEESTIDGVGFMFDPKTSPIVGIDIDKISKDPQRKEIADQLLKDFSSYSELSPSKNGFHIYIKGKKVFKGSKNVLNGLEIYDSKRFFTVTGDKVGDISHIRTRQDALEEFGKQYFPKIEKIEAPIITRLTSQSDRDILDKAFGARNGDATESLYNGNINAYDNDRSSADLALISRLAFYTQDEGQLDNLFRSSMLCRSKWLDRPEYRRWTIEKAIGSLTETYDWNYEQEEIMPFNVKKDTGESNLLKLDDIAKERKEEYELEKNAPSTGLKFLDGIIKGFLPGHLYTMTGETNVGKTSVCCNFAYNVAEQGKKVLYFALEPGTTIVDYMASIKEQDTFENSRGKIFGISDNIDVVIDGVGNVSNLVEMVGELPHYDLIVVDHISYFVTGGQNYIEEQSKAVKTLAKFAKNNKTAILLVAHINKKSSMAKKQKLDFNSISGSAAFKQDSTEVLLLTKDGDDETHGFINVVKTKVGANGECCIKFKPMSAYVKDRVPLS